MLQTKDFHSEEHESLKDGKTRGVSISKNQKNSILIFVILEKYFHQLLQQVYKFSRYEVLRSLFMLLENSLSAGFLTKISFRQIHGLVEGPGFTSR